MSDSQSTTHVWGSQPDFVGPRHEYRESLMMRMLEPQLSDGPVLNAGCGGGSLTVTLLDRGLDVTSIDYSREFVDHVRDLVARRFPDRTPQPVVEWGDLHDLRFADGQFSTVVCGEVLEHLQDDVTAAAEIFRVMAPGGLLLLSVPANPHRYDWVDRWAGHERRYTVDGMSGLLSGAGFEDVKVIPWGFPLTGIYHRWVYRPMLRRRLQRESTQPATAGSGSTPGLAHRALRKAFEIDTRFVGKVPGWFGIIALARKPTA